MLPGYEGTFLYYASKTFRHGLSAKFEFGTRIYLHIYHHEVSGRARACCSTNIRASTLWDDELTKCL